MLHYYDASQDLSFAILINMERQPTTFTLPEACWRRIDTQAYFDDADYLSGEGRDPRQSHNVDLSAPVTLEWNRDAAGSSIVIQAAP